ncbi:SM-like, degradation of cytoplasmic mRNAs and positively regulates transcription initiation [Puccinia graminis f. sp. tritici]|uniref:U6 snRNA-associated Sm-like protein LSm1 n=1 Tax=Puccinia graminis f. sp. tritici TaxID=56615 RepID=A0A5B0SQX7_PUCGR|nr:SM-like, degradation of cytoplasmic mRNAs and positively regulates transcription initiation [Puccinia graminis f. sp. tritici]
MDNFLTNVPFTTSGALVDIVDISLRDGKKLIGVLRSYDQFANLVLQDTIERIHVGIESKEDHQDSNSQHDQQQIAEGSETQNNKKKKKKDGICKYTDIWRGIYLVRGENVVLLGEIDLDKEDEIIKRFEYHSLETVSELQQQEIQTKAERVKKDEKILFDRLGFSKEGDEDDRY